LGVVILKSLQVALDQGGLVWQPLIEVCALAMI
jgi:hypothetical protein